MRHFDRRLTPRIDGIQWLTTAPNPRVRATGFDAGQRGWVLHAIIADDTEKFSDVARRPAFCGLTPRHGWGLDMFIVRRCLRCARKLHLS